MKKRFAITVLALALTAGSAMTSFGSRFYRYRKRRKVSVG